MTDDEALTAPLITMAVVFVASQVLGPLHEALGYDLGNRMATALNDRLMAATLGPPAWPTSSAPISPTTCRWHATSISASRGRRCRTA